MNAELPHTMRVAVAVADSRTGDHFAFEVPERARALHAFKHPFSYAAWQGVEANSSCRGARI